MTPHRILLVDDHSVVREGLNRILERESGFQVVGETDNGTDVNDAIRRTEPDLVLMDISLPGKNGLQATRELREAFPSVKVLALSIHEDPGYVTEILQAGATGYLLKRTPPEELVRAIRSVLEGKIYVDPRISEVVIRCLVQNRTGSDLAPDELSDRETRVLRSIALGYTTREIAHQLSISTKTVETYKARAMEKLNLSNRVDIVRYAGKRGWLSQPLQIESTPS